MKRSSAELKRIARSHLQGHYGLSIGAFVISLLIASAATMIPSFIFPLLVIVVPTVAGRIAVLGIFFIIVAAISLILMVLYCGLIRLHLKFARGEQVSLSDLFYGFRARPHRIILASLLYFVLSFVCTIPGAIFSGITTIVSIFSSFHAVLIFITVLLSIAGCVVLIIVGLHFAMTFVLYIDRPDMGTIEAFRTSGRLMKGNKGRLFYISLSFIGWMLLGILTCYIGLLWIIPYMIQTITEFYRDITGELDLA